MALDCLVGLIAAFVLYEHRYALWQRILDLQAQLNDSVEYGITFITHQPAGFKLNAPLNYFMGRLAIATVQSVSWGDGGVVLFVLICALGCFGATVMLAALYDMIRLGTAHLGFLFTVAARLYYLHLHLLASLWRLFRGRKHNPLKKRVDTFGSNNFVFSSFFVADAN
jgi:phosphatidylinositol glycan class Q protein